MVYTKLGQSDYAAEIAALRAAKPDAVFFFLPGGMGINFLKQYAQAGLNQTIPVIGPAFSIDEPQRCKSRSDSEPRRQGCRRSVLLQSLGNAGSGLLRLSRKGNNMRKLLFFQ